MMQPDLELEAWLAKHTEAIIEPALPIIDPHHHLWLREGSPYLFPELLADIASGHNIAATVFLECHSMYRAHGPEPMRPVGETEFVAGVAAMSESGGFGPTRACTAIVGKVEMTQGGAVEPILQAHVVAAGGRFRGVRYSTGWDASEQIRNVVPDAHRLADPRVREGIAVLDRMGLSLDLWLYHPQLGEVSDLAAAFPGLTIVLNHVGSPILGGPYRGRRDEVFAAWKTGMAAVAEHRNVVLKLGALPIRLPGGDFDRAVPPSSQETEAAWRPWLEPCIEMFGADRCMFESNFPVQRRWCSYQVVWNAFKRIAAGASAAEKADLFHGTAARAYRIGPPPV